MQVYKTVMKAVGLFLLVVGISFNALSMSGESPMPNQVKVAFDSIERESPRSITILGKTLYFIEQGVHSPDTIIYASDNGRDQLMMKTNGKKNYGHATINGISYSMFDNMVRTDEVQHIKEHDEHPLEPKKQRKVVKNKVRSKGYSNQENNLVLIVDDQEVTIQPSMSNFDQSLYELNNSQLFSAQQLQDILISGTTLNSYVIEDKETSTVDVHSQITPEAMLKYYKENGHAMAEERLIGEIDSSIIMSNVILEQSLLPYLNLNHKETDILNRYIGYISSNVNPYNLRTSNNQISYRVVNVDDPEFKGKGINVCGFAAFIQKFKATTPEIRTLANTKNSDIKKHSEMTIRTGCLTPSTFLHEFGHSVGIKHNREQIPKDKDPAKLVDYAFNYGYADQESGVYSVLAYQCAGCSYVPLLSSSDRYDFKFGVSAYEVDAADAAQYMDTAFFIHNMPNEKQMQNITSSSEKMDSENKWTATKTFTWDMHDGAEHQSLIVVNYTQDLLYQYPLEYGSSSVTISTENLTSDRIEAYIVSGLLANENVQPIPVASFSINKQRTGVFLSQNETTSFNVPNSIKGKEEYEISFTVSDAEIDKVRERMELNGYSDWRLEIGKSALWDNFEATITSSIDDLLETGVIAATLTTPSAFEQDNLANIASNDFNLTLSLVATVTDSFNNTADMPVITGRFNLPLDRDDLSNPTSIHAKNNMIVYRKSVQVNPVEVSFELNSDSGRFDYDIFEGYARSGLSASAIIETETNKMSNGNLEVKVYLDANKIEQAQDDGYLVSVYTTKGLPAAKTVIVKNNDQPYFENNSFPFYSGKGNFSFTMLVDDLDPTQQYQAELSYYEKDSGEKKKIDVSFSEKELSETSSMFSATLVREIDSPEEHFFTVYPVTDNGAPIGNKKGLYSHSVKFDIVNVPNPIISCPDGTSCEFSLSQTGDYRFENYRVDQLLRDRDARYTWSSVNSPFAIRQDGEGVIISLPKEVDTSWSRFTLALTVSNGVAQTKREFVFKNANYKEEKKTIMPTPDESSQSGGSAGWLLISSLFIMVFVRRRFSH